MADGKWTKGPWKATPNGDGYVITRTDVFVAGYAIAAARPSRAATEDQCEANARLIAAAPDLYEALVEARERMVGSSPGLKALIAKTDAALSRARGETA